MREVIRRLGIEAEHVIFGHTHRRGPVGSEPGWSQPGEPQLHNVGSWVYAPGILGRSAADSPFWPGTIGILEDGGPPQIRALLDEHTHADLRRTR
jgi:hypothetical protein